MGTYEYIESPSARRKRLDRERYLRQREERLIRQREYYAAHREEILAKKHAKVRMRGFERVVIRTDVPEETYCKRKA